MSAIRILPDDLVNKIAAGEVVERPSSVVKELVENALDAGAGRITVAVRDGGRSSIVVEDDGVGISAGDLPLAIQRHATSKLSTVGDLAAIATLGFRGEALPSIASVSRFTLTSRTKGAPEGRRVRVEGGRIQPAEPAGLFEGTRVEVEDLFFNVPARRKFLRSPATELTHVITLMEHYALARPDCAFVLESDGRNLLNLAPSPDRTERFFELFPELPREDFTELEGEGPVAGVSGLAGKPARNLGTARYQFTLVNGRFIRDRLLQHAIAQAYENTHPKGRYPVVLLCLAVPFSKVDVNVHPAKREVRFVEGQAVHNIVAAAIRRAIAPGPPSAPRAARVSEPFSPYGGPPLSAPSVFGTHAAGGLFAPPLNMPASAPFQPAAPSPLRALCQWRHSFILCDSPEGLAIVDQHVAHERIRFEQFRRFLDAPGPRQAFLVPHRFTLPRQVAHRAEELAALLCAQGFEAEAGGEESVLVRSAPAFLSQSETDRLLSEFFESAAEVLKTPRDRWREVLIMRSCRGSVMLNDPLTPEKAQYLLDTLYALGAPLTCPHGRPIVFTLKESELLAKFDRK